MEELPHQRDAWFEADKRGLTAKDHGPPISFSEFFSKTVSFSPHEWQIKYICPILESLAHEKGRRFLIHGPPQMGKSILVSKRFPAWALGINPLLRIVLAGYNVTHAKGFCEVVRDIMHSEEYAECFPSVKSRIPKVCPADVFSTKARADLLDGQDSLTAVGLLSGFTGKGADILIIDDPYASPDDARSRAINERVWRWWTELAKVRINDDTNVLVMFHRYHEDDFAGRLLAEGGWEYKRFPAIADENEDGDDPTGRQPGEPLSPMRSLQFFDKIRNDQPQVWLSQFQGRPRRPEGAFLKREWLRPWTGPLPDIKYWVRFWDLTSMQAKDPDDWTAGALVGIADDQTVILKDVTRFRMEWPQACELIVDISEQDHEYFKSRGSVYAVGVEEVFWQMAMIQDLFLRGIFKRVALWPMKPKGDKKQRASGWAARAKHNRFRYVPGGWDSQAFISECLAFDGLHSVHDDQIDAVSGAFALLWSLRGDQEEENEPINNTSPEYFQAIGRQASGEPGDGFWGPPDDGE